MNRNTQKRARMQEGAQRRNYQIGGCKKRSVHAAPEPEKKPKKKQRRRNAWNGTNATSGAREPYKLDARMTQKFVESILEVPGAPIELHCQRLGVARSTYYRWTERAADNKERNPIYRHFVNEVEKAM